MAKVKLSVIREIKNEFYGDWREIVEAMADDEDDFEVGKYRFIFDGSIDEIMADELESDEYCLGSANAWAIAEATDWPEVLIEAAQAGDNYDKVGAAMTREHVEKLAEIIVENDGYGSHFASYDGKEQTFGSWYAFRIG